MDSTFLESNLLGLRQVRILRCEYGFGFTLRHFIVYPPDQNDKFDYSNGSAEKRTESSHHRLGRVTEPVDTIFVRSVREDGPANLAGLCIGDRIVSVNGDRIVGRSYDQVVHLIQSSPHFVDLEVSPRQYDTLQLFYEDKAYRPETNQRPQLPLPPPPQHLRRPSASRLSHTQSLELYSQPIPPPRRTYPPPNGFYSDYATLPLTLNHRQRHYRHLQEEDMSSTYPNSQIQQHQQQQPIFSHLPTPPPYKSTINWSHLNHPVQPSHKKQPQTYYPFQTPEIKPNLWGIREETQTSSDSVVLVGGSSGSSSNTLNSNRYGSMECLSGSAQPPVTWKNSPGYRFSISTGPGDHSSLEVLQPGIEAANAGGLPGFISPTTNQNQEMMIVTMSGGMNELSDYNGGRGYETKMADRIRRSTEQKEEFLKRPTQPLQWTPAAVFGSTVPFPKEFYAQPQKFQKTPWPPETQSKHTGSAIVSDELMTVSMRNYSTKQHLAQFNYGGSLDETCSKRRGLENTSSTTTKLQQQQSFPTHQIDSIRNKQGGLTKSNRTETEFPITGKNRITLVGCGKLHCDPPKGWKHPTISLDETESQVQNADTDVILRKRDDDTDYENERLVRRVSYLKATSSPIDMDRKSSSPTTPTKSPSSDFRQFGSSSLDKTSDTSSIIREGQVNFKVRAGEAKKGGYYRAWRQGWAQVRSSGCLYLSKERMPRETISGTEADIILCIGLKDGVTMEHAEDYTKRKHVLRLRTTGNTSSGDISSSSTGPIPVEILIQGEDVLDTGKWLSILQQQQDNNNTSLAAGLRINTNEMSSPRSLLRTFLGQENQTSNLPPSTSNYLTPASAQILATSPKSKTWKGRVAKQWKKIHTTTNSSQQLHPSSPLHSQMSIPESGATFGVLLEDCPQSENCLVPRILEYCVQLVETKGLSVVGIYRIPGNNAAISALMESMNKGNDINPEADPRWLDIHVISSLLKCFFRKLPDPLLTSARYSDFIKAAADPDSAKGLERIRNLIQELPDANYETLRHLILHLVKVASHSKYNRMEPKNLAIVFGPTVVRTAQENVTSLVNDMQYQCKIIELLISHAVEIFGDKDESHTPPLTDENHQIDQKSESRHLPTQSSSPKMEKDIRASLIQAAMRKKQNVVHQQPPPHNTYGLPPGPLERDRSVDETGLIRSYAGLGEETEQRVRQFEIETRAHLCRDTRSPGIPSSNLYSTTGKVSLETDKLKQEKIRLEAEWRRAKEDLENEDYYDQLADDPSVIVHHHDTPYQSNTVTNPTTHSNSSLSSTNSGGTPSIPVFGGTWPVRLGPVPFKSQFSSENLPPKPPPLQFGIVPYPNVRKVPGTPPLRKQGSMERLSLHCEEFQQKNSSQNESIFKRFKNIEINSGGLHYDSKAFGSLDSLQNLANDSRDKSHGSDMVSTLTKTFDEKMEELRKSTERKSDQNNGKPGGKWGKGLTAGHRRNSLNETRRKLSLDERAKNGMDHQVNHSKHTEKYDGPNGHAGGIGIESKKKSSKKGKDVQRRHSLSGTVDILRLMLGDQKKSMSHQRHSQVHVSSDGLTTTALKTNNILESHV